jgi:hypothetical protein
VRATTQRGAVAVAVSVIALAFVVGVTVVALVSYLAERDGLAAPSAAISPPPAGSETPSAATPVASASSAGVAVLLGAGDIANCDLTNDQLTADLVESLPGSVFTLGDNAYPHGSPEDFRDCYGPTWGRPSIKARTRPTVGDHEYETPGAKGYFNYFGAAAGEADKGYYAYDAGTWRVYVLNSRCSQVGGCRAGSPQDLWLRKDLAENPRRCVVAMWHAPLFSSGAHGPTAFMKDLAGVLDDAGAELVLSGNDHDYERFAPQSVDGVADRDGLVQFVVGTGGAETGPFGTPQPNSLVRASNVAGVLRLELRPDSYSFEFITVAGPQFEDSGTAACH